MSRTIREKRPRMNLGNALADHQYKSGKVRDGTPQHASRSCKNKGGCPQCEGNRIHANRRRTAAIEIGGLE